MAEFHMQSLQMVSFFPMMKVEIEKIDEKYC
jgi:hypothetical protein